MPREFRFDRTRIANIVVNNENGVNLATAQAVVAHSGTEATVFMSNEQIRDACGGEISEADAQNLRDRAGWEFLHGTRDVKIPRS